MTETLSPEQIAELGKQFAESLAADWHDVAAEHGIGLVDLSFETGGDDTDSDRASTESADPTVDAIIDRAAAAGVIVADEVRRKVQALVKKKYRGRNS